MKKRLPVLALLLVALVLVPAAAFAGTSSSSGMTANAWGELYAPDAMWPSLWAFAWGGEQSTVSHYEQGKPVRYAYSEFSAMVDYPTYDQDGNPVGVWASYSVTVPECDMGIDRDLTRAGVQATAEGLKYTYSWVPSAFGEGWETVTLTEEPIVAELDFSWTGTGDLTTYKNRMLEWMDGYRWMNSSRGAYRECAIVGSFVVDGVDLIEGVELTGSIDKSKSHDVQFGEFPYFE